MVELFANSGDPAASDLGLHCLPNALLGVSRLQWVKDYCEDSVKHLLRMNYCFK